MVMNCLDSVKEMGYNLQGYSPDTIYELWRSEGTRDQCEALFFYLESVYG